MFQIHGRICLFSYVYSENFCNIVGQKYRPYLKKKLAQMSLRDLSTKIVQIIMLDILFLPWVSVFQAHVSNTLIQGQGHNYRSKCHMTISQ